MIDSASRIKNIPLRVSGNIEKAVFFGFKDGVECEEVDQLGVY